ncbi:chorion class CB protein PC404-like [Pieris brassicae]|uniref:chorion class CB protein PC404-like n=1 Tax=Pieris brassicae TaxID=7116 RepID=UPI001E6622B0|nr:chorion class CB protein PC404-like [Pieris brassicae]
MSFKIIIFCAQAFLMQSITAQYIGNAFAENIAWSPSYPMPYGPVPVPYSPAPVPFTPNPPAPVQYASAPVPYAPTPMSYAPTPSYMPNSYYVSSPYNPGSLSASNACGLAVSSSSPMAPVGVTMMSENAFEGPLAVAGQIPFLGAIGVEGNLPTSGAGAVSYNSGNGQVAIMAEDLVSYGYPGYSYGANGYTFEGYY